MLQGTAPYMVTSHISVDGPPSCWLMFAPQQYAAPLAVVPQLCAAPARTLENTTVTTVTIAVPLLVSLVAVIVAEPAATPVTNPVEFTVATAALLLAQVTTRPVSTFPFASAVVAVSCTVWPTSTVGVGGATVTDATGGMTVSAAVPGCPSLVAVIVAEPAATPVTSPVGLTVATVALLVVHVTVRPVSTLLAASLVVAVSCAVPASPIVAIGGETVTDATAGGGPSL